MGRLDDFDSPGRGRASISSTARSLSSRTRFDFDPKMDGSTRLDFSRVPKGDQRPASPSPRKRVYHNTLKGVAAELPMSSAKQVAGDKELKRASVCILAER